MPWLFLPVCECGAVQNRQERGGAHEVDVLDARCAGGFTDSADWLVTDLSA